VDASHASDEELMRHVAAGSRAHLSQLMRRYASPLLTFLTRMTGDSHTGEELFQEVFLAVWTGRKTYEYPRPVRNWLFGIAANKCRAEHRQAAREWRPVSSASASAPAGDDPAPHEVAVATETAALVEQAVLRLPEQQRRVVVLRVWNGYGYAAIARMVGRSEATVRSHMFHALNALRKFLEPKLRERE
jgi:RNA polymerase sigma-70 factor (ECF subfamily)